MDVDNSSSAQVSPQTPRDPSCAISTGPENRESRGLRHPGPGLNLAANQADTWQECKRVLGVLDTYFARCSSFYSDEDHKMQLGESYLNQPSLGNGKLGAAACRGHPGRHSVFQLRNSLQRPSTPRWRGASILVSIRSLTCQLSLLRCYCNRMLHISIRRIMTESVTSGTDFSRCSRAGRGRIGKSSIIFMILWIS